MQADEVQYAILLNKMGYLPGPKECKCGGKQFNIQYDGNYKTSHACFRCIKKDCRNRHQIRINSFFNNFPKIQLKTLSEIIKCFICYEMNANATFKYISSNFSISINIATIRNIFQEIRNVIFKYYYIVYQSELLGYANENNNFSVDESHFTSSLNGEPIWVLGAINNATKDFRLEAVKIRDSNILKLFITTYIERGNKIITDRWSGYSFLANEDGYDWDPHTHGAGDFGFGLSSTSHIEQLWHQLKDKIRKIYNSIPFYNFLHYLREAEWRIKYNRLSHEQKLYQFFESYNLTVNVSDISFKDAQFLSVTEFSKKESCDDDDNSD